MFTLSTWALVGFFGGAVVVIAAILFFLLRGDRKKAEKIFNTARTIAVDIVEYVEQVSKNTEMTNEEKKALAVTKLKETLKELYGWDVSEAVLDIAIELGVSSYNFLRDLLKKKEATTN